VRPLISHTAVSALCVIVALGAATPCAAGPAAAPKAPPTLTRLSPATRQMLATATPAPVAAQDPGAAGATAPKSFFKSGKGKVTLALMGAGVGFTLWSIQHDRKPVRSPIR
jgi:hypothetical protein